jgi:uncharacterized membrane protein required for colicin V production
MGSIVSWILGVFMAAVGLAGLTATAKAADPFAPYIGMALFIFAFIFLMILIKTNIGNKPKEEA